MATADSKVQAGQTDLIDPFALVSRKEAADMLGVHVRTVDRYVSLGRLQKIKVGSLRAQSNVKFYRSEVQSLLTPVGTETGGVSG
jgi:excisionase family DNA binding protein